MEIKNISWKPTALTKYKKTALWYYHNMGKNAATKFITGINKDVYRIKSQPNIGPREPLLIDQPIEFHSLVSHRHTKIINFIEQDNLYIVDLWDCRQDTISLSKSIPSL